MELLAKTKEELFILAEELKIDMPGNASVADLRDKIERVTIENTVKIKEEIRSELQRKAKIKQDIAEIKIIAESSGIKIAVPENPTIEDVVRLREKVGLKKKEPRPSPETIAIENSKRVYAIFHNMEQRDLDISCTVGGKYRFHFWPEKVHVIPQWIVGYLRKQCSVPIYEQQEDKLRGIIKPVQVDKEQRFMFEVITDAPDNASFGVVLDDKTLNEIQQPT